MKESRAFVTSTAQVSTSGSNLMPQAHRAFRSLHRCTLHNQPINVGSNFPRFHLNFSCIVGGHGRRLRTIANTTAAIRLAPPMMSNTKEVGFAVAAAQLFNSIQARAVIGGVFAGRARYRS